MIVRNLFVILITLAGNVSAQLTLEDIFKYGKYREKSPENLKFKQNDHFYTVQENNSVLMKETVSGKIKDTVICKTDTINQRQFSMFDYEFSENEKLILLAGNKKGIYRRSFTADYFVYSTETGLISKVNPPGSRGISYAAFSPDGSKVAFVADNNLFYYDILTRTHHQLTTDGKKNYIINGSTDWVFEEEFEIVKAFEWSPDSRCIAFLKFNETDVKEYNMQKWTGLYPEDYRYKYPKAGEKNSLVSLHVVNTRGDMMYQIGPDSVSTYYIRNLRWINSGQNLLFVKMNRLQNALTFSQLNITTGSIYDIYSKQTSRYFETDAGMHISEKRNELYLPGNYLDDDCLFSLKLNGKSSVKKITGLNELHISAINDSKGYLYCTSPANKPENQYCYRISLKNGKEELLSEDEGTSHIQISESGNYYIISNSSSGRPPSFHLYDANSGRLVRKLEDNFKLRQEMEQLKLEKQEFFQISTKEQVSLQAWLIKPLNFDSSKKYPLIMFVYGGPGSQMVKNAWGAGHYLWHQFLAKNGYLVACVDGRGTGGKGSSFRSITYRNLGDLETTDQIASAVYFSELPFVDKGNIGIWGWSFGGYLSANCILKGNNIFSAAIAVAPVTNWRFYDTIYSERYLGLPGDNTKGYDANSPVNYANMLKGKFFLIHGTADDNVHIQNTYMLQQAFIQTGKEFETFIYPNKSHGLSGGNTRYYLFSSMFSFWNKSLK